MSSQIMFTRLLLACLGLLLASPRLAAELGVGSTREDVIALLGAPKTTTTARTREILGYPNGRITLEDQRVVSIDWKGSLLVEPPAPPSPSAISTPEIPVAMPAAPAPPDAWRIDFAAAQAEAAASKRQLLVLFTGSDWCPACINFEAQVAHTEAFLKGTRSKFVLVKLDFPHSTPQAPGVLARNRELQRLYQIDWFPTLLVINPDGTVVGQVDTSGRALAPDLPAYYVRAAEIARASWKKWLPW